MPDIDTQRLAAYRIGQRFFEAIYELKRLKIIRGKQSFTEKFNIDRRNLYRAEKNPQGNNVQLAWLTYLIDEYNVSAEWLMLGKGEMFYKE